MVVGWFETPGLQPMKNCLTIWPARATTIRIAPGRVEFI